MVRRRLAWIALFAAACGSKSPVSEPAAAPRVCCSSYGYGAGMEKCCETTEWTAPDACVTPEGLVGGGKEVVDDAKCE